MSGRPIAVKLLRLAHSEGLPLPAYHSAGAAGLDILAAISEPVVLEPGAYRAIPTGVALELPPLTEAQVRPRSGLALKHGVTVLNSPGTIDADYRGEIAVILINHGCEPFRISRGDRIAQLVIAPLAAAILIEVKILSASDRGSGGFGSTGEGAPAKKLP